MKTDNGKRTRSRIYRYAVSGPTVVSKAGKKRQRERHMRLAADVSSLPAATACPALAPAWDARKLGEDPSDESLLSVFVGHPRLGREPIDL